MDDLYFKLALTTTAADARQLLEDAFKAESDTSKRNHIAAAMAFQKLNSDHKLFLTNLREILYNQFCDVIKLSQKKC